MFSIISLVIENFKGIKHLSIPFNTITNIFGNNATGKTTIFDAFTWLLFDKDSQDRTSFEIKPLDGRNNPIHFLETSVEGRFNCNGKSFILKKVFKEKWVKKRGQEEQEFSGNTTDYYVEGIPVKATEYKQTISGMLDEKTFKLLTNPLAFETSPWKDKRNILFEICGSLTDQEVITSNSKLQGLSTYLDDKDIETFKKHVAAMKKQFKQDIENIPPRIDELTKSIEEIDKLSIVKVLEIKQAHLKELDESLEANNKVFDEIRSKQQEIFKLEQTKAEVIQKAKVEANKGQLEAKDQVNAKTYELRNIQNQQDRLAKEIETLRQENILNEKTINDFREEYQKVFGTVFDETNKICPTCGQDLQVEKVNYLISEFENKKNDSLIKIQDAGKKLNADIETKNNRLIKATEEFEQLAFDSTKLKTEIEGLNQIVFAPVADISIDTTEIDAQIDVIKQEIQNYTSQDTTSIKAKKQEVAVDIDRLKDKLTRADIQEGTKARIDELHQKHKDLCKQLADVEKQEFLVEEFTKTKVDMLEELINSRFKYVTFKLFSEQVNGGIAECCESLINGVPFSNANNAARINAGLDIINTLSKYYGFNAPIFVDNAESVVELISVDSQIVRLIVSESDKELRVE